MDTHEFTSVVQGPYVILPPRWSINDCLKIDLLCSIIRGRRHCHNTRFPVCRGRISGCKERRQQQFREQPMTYAFVNMRQLAYEKSKP